MSSKAWFMIFSGSSNDLSTLLMFDLATRVNLSNRFIDKEVYLYAVVDGIGGKVRLVNEEVVENALADASEATRTRAVRKFMASVVSALQHWRQDTSCNDDSLLGRLNKKSQWKGA